MFRARIKSAFSVAGHGTFIGVEILDGEIRIGDEILVPLGEDERVVTVRAVEYLDHIAEGKAQVGLGVVGIEPVEVAVGGELRAKPG